MRAVDADAAVKLLHSMRVRSGLIGELRERLHAMADANQVVIECEGNRFNLIATPEALANEAGDTTKEGGTEVPTPRGARKTTYARTGDGKDLPAHLQDKHVGPLSVTYKDPEAGEAIATAAALVFEELVKAGKHRYGRNELLAMIQALLLPLYYGKVEVAQTLAMPLLCFLVDNGHAKRVNVPGRRDEIVIEIVLPQAGDVEVAEVTAQVELDPIELLSRLAPELEAARAQLAEMELLLESSVDPETVAKITAKAEELQGKNEGLRRDLETAAAEKERIAAANSARVAKIRSEHSTALAALRKEYAANLASVQQKLDAALAEKAELEKAAQRRAMSPELQRRVEKLLEQ
jgi:hypothetical protein